MSTEATTWLISDLHLDPARPETTRLLLDFLAGPAREAHTLYILGDLFEAWIGDDAPGETGRLVAAGLRRLSRDGVDIRLLVGNRDFLLGDDFCRQAGMQRREEPVRIRTGDGEALLMHGDTLCTDDVAYQRLRRKVRDPAWQQRMLSRPVWWRKLLARVARMLSRRHTGNSGEAIMDVNDAAVAQCFRDHGVRRIIHGHTHRLAMHDLKVDGRHCQRIVLGDWHETGNVLCINDESAELRIVTRGDDGNIELRRHESAAPLADTETGEAARQAPGNGS